MLDMIKVLKKKKVILKRPRHSTLEACVARSSQFLFERKRMMWKNKVVQEEELHPKGLTQRICFHTKRERNK